MSRVTLEQELQAARARIAELQQRLQTRTSDSEVNLRALIDETKDSIFVIDVATGRFLEWNESACRNLQYTADELAQMRVQDIEAVLPDDFQWNAHMRHLSQVKYITINGDHRRKDGSTFPVEVNTTFVGGEAGDYLITIVRDVTERHQEQAKIAALQASLQEASRRAGMSDIVSGLLHNVGNVLNSVNINSEVMLEKLESSRISQLQKVVQLLLDNRDDLAGFLSGDQGKATLSYLQKLTQLQREHHDELVSRTQALRKHIDHMRNIIAVQQSYVHDPEVMDRAAITQLLDDAIELNQASLERHGIEVTKHYDDLPPMLIDKHKVMQILLNLVSNAHRALVDADISPKHLTLRATRKGDDRVSVHVRDNGIGVPEELLPKIFQLGFTTKARGHGFGLHMSAVSADEIGGSLSCTSDGPGKGADFTLELPILLGTEAD